MFRMSAELHVCFQGREVSAQFTLECMFSAQECKFPVWLFFVCDKLAEQKNSLLAAGWLTELFTTPCAGTWP